MFDNEKMNTYLEKKLLTEGVLYFISLDEIYFTGEVHFAFCHNRGNAELFFFFTIL